MAPAWRQCREAGVLSPETAGRYTANPADLSYVPAAIRRLAGPEASTLADHFHRPRYAKLNGAHAIRDWREVGAGDWFSSDDFTLEVYFYIPDGQGWWKLTRGQWLPLVDCRSKKILDFILIPEKHYTAGNIRTVINHGCSRWGLPRRGFHFECGTWKQASLLGGPVPFGDVETTFAERLGVRIIHARPGNARAKIVENVGKLFQGRLRGEQGWCGPNEQVFKREELQRAARDVAARRMAPWEAGFLSFEQWFKRLEEHAAAYNQAPQASRVMGGNREVTMSPDEAWETLQSRDDGGAVIPVVKLPDDLRYLLVMHAQKVTVRAKGGIRCLNRTYANAETARLAGREVTVYLDHERPEHVQVVLDGDHVLTVPRVPSVPAFDASPEHFKSVADTAGAHNRGLSARVSELKARFMPPTRRVYADQASVAQGRVMAEQSRAFKEAERSAGHKDARLKALSRSTGMPILEDAPDLERGLTEMNKFLSHVD
ncbi:MAG: Mu transposase C-terminal domain-containing protein [Verrucomicrobia bacterium]|nr:Mu transposase C-terminal domain-containing protein [Verrucomicrobiota bacterium]